MEKKLKKVDFLNKKQPDSLIKVKEWLFYLIIKLFYLFWFLSSSGFCDNPVDGPVSGNSTAVSSSAPPSVFKFDNVVFNLPSNTSIFSAVNTIFSPLADYLFEMLQDFLFLVYLLPQVPL